MTYYIAKDRISFRDVQYAVLVGPRVEEDS